MQKLAIFGAALALAMGAPNAFAQADNAQDATVKQAGPAATLPPPGIDPGGDAAKADGKAGAKAKEALPKYEPLGPEMIRGAPAEGRYDVQTQFSDDGDKAVYLHTILVWVMGIISLFVLGLLLWVLVRYNRRANPEASNVTHNVKLEFLWTLVPFLILAGISIPSISLLAKQYRSPPENAITVKATGSQWFWTYGYPDHGEFEVISNMMPVADAKAKGLPALLAVDNRMVLPVGVPIRLQTTATDVIHSFAVPSLWFKLDAVPGRLNERTLLIKEPGIYYGQCSELCGLRHGYMPIAIEAVPQAKFEQWVKSQGGKLPREIAAEKAAEEAKAKAEKALADAEALKAEAEAQAVSAEAKGKNADAEAAAAEKVIDSAGAKSAQ